MHVRAALPSLLEYSRPSAMRGAARSLQSHHGRAMNAPDPTGGLQSKPVQYAPKFAHTSGRKSNFCCINRLHSRHG